MKVKLKIIIRKLFNKMRKIPSYLKIDLELKKKWYGNIYGGFYVHPDIINENSIVYSFGVGEDLSFDLEMIERHNCNVFCFDPTPKSIKWVKNQKLNEKIHFYEFGISNKNEFENLYLPKNSNHVSGSVVIHKNIDINNFVRVEMKTLSSIMKKLNHSYLDVLKIDIEGAEFLVIENILNESIPIKQIMIEFHDRLIDYGKNKIKNSIELLHKKGYKIFAISDSLEEISFIRHY
jgi:FkbM family methyltransferase